MEVTVLWTVCVCSTLRMFETAIAGGGHSKSRPTMYAKKRILSYVLSPNLVLITLSPRTTVTAGCGHGAGGMPIR